MSANTIEELLEEVERLAHHSVLLNTIVWSMADALGDIPEGATEHAGSNPLDLVDRLVNRSWFLPPDVLEFLKLVASSPTQTTPRSLILRAELLLSEHTQEVNDAEPT